MRRAVSCLTLFSCLTVGGVFVGDAAAARPSVKDALRLVPLQSDVNYDLPKGEDVDRCKVESESGEAGAGWQVKNGGGQLLRRFLDTNGDKRVDLWCYFKNGIEVYRDIDSDYNGNADQHRWLGTEGSRWGVDPKERGKIQYWKTISAEEVTSELVAALRAKDATRFERLLLTGDELKSLGLSDDKAREIAAKISAAPAAFAKVADRQTLVQKDSQWVHFGARRPGVVPASPGGPAHDLVVYENVASMIETDGKHSQLVVGTLVRVGDVWRLIDIPSGLNPDEQASGAFFFETPLPTPTEMVAHTSGVSKEVQGLIADLERVDKALQSASSAREKAELNAKHADVLQRLAEAGQGEERTSWIRQFADTVSAAVQTGDYPDGEQRLSALATKLHGDGESKEIVSYVKFRAMTASYGKSLQSPNADFPKIQEAWLKQLEAFVKAFPQQDEAAEAMLQLAIAEEFAGRDSAAAEWYRRIADDFPQSVRAKKAEGARRRLQSLGKTITLRGKTLSGQAFDLTSYRGKPVIVQYWATWCEPCKSDMEEFKKLQAKYARSGLAVVGVNLDSQRADAERFVQAQRIPWPQLYEEGGLDSRLANELGILTLPTTFLLDQQGKVISRNISVGELPAELDKLSR